MRTACRLLLALLLCAVAVPSAGCFGLGGGTPSATETTIKANVVRKAVSLNRVFKSAVKVANAMGRDGSIPKSRFPEVRKLIDDGEAVAEELDALIDNGIVSPADFKSIKAKLRHYLDGLSDAGVPVEDPDDLDAPTPGAKPTSPVDTSDPLNKE